MHNKITNIFILLSISCSSIFASQYYYKNGEKILIDKIQNKEGSAPLSTNRVRDIGNNFEYKDINGMVTVIKYL